MDTQAPGAWSSPRFPSAQDPSSLWFLSSSVSLASSPCLPACYIRGPPGPISWHLKLRSSTTKCSSQFQTKIPAYCHSAGLPYPQPVTREHCQHHLYTARLGAPGAMANVLSQCPNPSTPQLALQQPTHTAEGAPRPLAPLPILGPATLCSSVSPPSPSLPPRAQGHLTPRGPHTWCDPGDLVRGLHLSPS